MDLRQLTDSQCGQTNPLVQMSEHVREDHTFVDRIGIPTSALGESNSMPPQSFKMSDLINEMKEIEYHQDSSLVLNHSFSRTTQANLGNSSFVQPPQATHFYEHIPQYICLPHQTQGRTMTEGLLQEIHECQSDFMGLAIDDQAKYLVVESLAELKDTEDLIVLQANSLRASDNQNLNFQKEVPQTMCLPNELPYLSLRPYTELRRKPEQFPVKINSLQLECERLPIYNKDKYKVVHSLDELEDVQDTLEEHQETSAFSQGAEEKDMEDSDENDELCVKDLLRKGKEFLSKGNLTDAILCFEAVVREDNSCAEVWTLLGTSYSENLREYEAIKALKQALIIVPDNLKALMQLAVSYTNQLNKYKAYSMLILWLKNHPEYKDIVPENFNFDYENIDKEGAVLKLFIKAAQKHRFNVDYEVQCALALICDLNCEYDKALDCISAALRVLPNDARLWNRLGVFLSKNDQVDEAIDTFKHAVSLDPNFRLLHYNLAINYKEKRNLREAGKHFSIFLNLQARRQGEVISSKHTSGMVWMHLLALAISIRCKDLLHAVKDRDLNKINKLF